MPRKNNDAYALAALGQFTEKFAAARNQYNEYKEKLAKEEIERKRKEQEDKDRKAQQDFDNRLKLGAADKELERLGQKTTYIGEDGKTYESAGLDPAVVKAGKDRLRALAGDYNYGKVFGDNPSLPPLPVPAPAAIPPYIARNEEPLPPIPSSGVPVAAPGPVPPDLPKDIKKYPTFNDDSVREGAETRRGIMGLSDDYRKDAKPFADTVDTFQEAREAYKRAKFAVASGQSSSVADKSLLFSMIRAQNGSRPTDKDVELAIKQGDLGEQALNMYNLAIRGQMSQKMRDDIYKLTRDAMVSKEKEFKTNVEDEYIKKAKFLAPGADPSLIVTKKRPTDWEDVKREYDAEYEQGQQTGQGAAWTPEQETAYQTKKRELEAIRKAKGKK